MWPRTWQRIEGPSRGRGSKGILFRYALANGTPTRNTRSTRSPGSGRLGQFGPAAIGGKPRLRLCFSGCRNTNKQNKAQLNSIPYPLIPYQRANTAHAHASSDSGHWLHCHWHCVAGRGAHHRAVNKMQATPSFLGCVLFSFFFCSIVCLRACLRAWIATIQHPLRAKHRDFASQLSYRTRTPSKSPTRLFCPRFSPTYTTQLPKKQPPSVAISVIFVVNFYKYHNKCCAI